MDHRTKCNACKTIKLLDGDRRENQDDCEYGDDFFRCNTKGTLQERKDW